MGIEQEILQRAEDLKTQRFEYEAEWDESARLVLPSNPDFLLFTDWQNTGLRRLSPNATKSKKIYDNTAVWAVRRLQAGLESLQMPSNEKWHGLKLEDFFSPPLIMEDKKYLENVVDYLFSARYHPKSNFGISNQHALRQSIVFGTGLYMTLDNRKTKDAKRRPFRYRGLLLGRCYLDVDGMDNHDTFCERGVYTARQLRIMYGEKLSEKIKEYANDPDRKDYQFEIVHMIQPREEAGSRRGPEHLRNSDFASYVVEVESEKMVEDSGFFDFPVTVYTWDRVPGQPYGQGPISENKPDIKVLNNMSKTSLAAGQQMIAPPYGVPHGGMFNRLNLNTRAINPGAVNEQGQLLARPLVDGIRPEYGETMMEQRRASIRQGLFVDLFQIILNEPNLTATEALIRADEKGQLLGPIGTNLQRGLATLIDREMGILLRRGAFDQGTPFELPPSLQGKEFGPSFKSPLERMRRSQEVLGIQRTFEGIAPIAQIAPETVLAPIDLEETLKIMAEVNGAPMKIFKSKAKREQEKAQQDQMQQAQQMLGVGQQIADVANTAVPAATQSAELMQAISSSGGAGIPQLTGPA